MPRQNPTAIVVLVARRRSLSAAVERWIEGWLRSRHEHSSALVLLLEKRIVSAQNDATVIRLQREAGENGVDFLCEFSEPATSRANAGTEQRLYRETVIRWAMKDIIEEAVALKPSGING